jgi:predicted DNA-binding transcriptional regulator AlpA
MTLVSIPTLGDLAADPHKVSLLAQEAIPGIRGELARLDSLLLARLLSATRNGDADRAEEGDRLLNAKEASAKLSLSEDHLYRNAAKFPFTVRLGRRLRFSEAGIARFIRQRMGR